MTSPKWFAQAACRGIGPDFFFPEGLSDARSPEEHRRIRRVYERARKTCHSCPVRRACLDFALATNQPEGMWGGLTPNERTKHGDFLRTRESA